MSARFAIFRYFCCVVKNETIMTYQTTFVKKEFLVFFVTFAILLSCSAARAQVDVIEEPVCEVVEEVIYEIAEVRPEFPGGHTELMRFISRSMHPYGFRMNIQGTVLVQFIIRKDGSITDIEVMRTPCIILAREAVRIVETMPKWTPAKNNGEKVNSRFTLPVQFRYPF